VTRRQFLNTTGEVAVGAALATLGAAAASAQQKQSPPEEGPRPDSTRATRAYDVRVSAAKYERDQPPVAQKTNGDEAGYEKKWGSFSKGLPHNEIGEVEPSAYRAYIKAIESGRPEELEQIPLGGYLKLSNPHAALAYDLVGPDSHQIAMPAPPPFASEDCAGEMVELYWKALLRDVPFDQYERHELSRSAQAELSSIAGFRGPRRNGKVTAETLCRGASRGGQLGPYVSQFLLRDIPFTPIRIPQKIRTAAGGKNYVTDPAEWLAIQNGGLAGVNTFDDQPRHLRNGRDLGEYVHRDFSYQLYLNAAVILLKASAPLDGSIPYQYSVNQGGFVTFGAPDVLHFVASVANCSLKAAWYQKWIVHRTARPEEIGGRVHFHLTGKGKYPLHPALLKSEAVERVKKLYGSMLLPQAYPEGCPSHPSYPAGHAVIAGACATVLKAWFVESWVLPKSFVPNADGTALQPWTGADLTVGNELDKLAENVAFGRNFAGIHSRSDATEGLLLGEAFAINFLREMKLTSRELFAGFSLMKFDGTQVTV
jgi:hypothetical protein